MGLMGLGLGIFYCMQVRVQNERETSTRLSSCVLMSAIQRVSLSNSVSVEGSEGWQKGCSTCCSCLGLGIITCKFGSRQTYKKYFMCLQKIIMTKFWSHSYLIRTFL